MFKSFIFYLERYLWFQVLRINVSNNYFDLKIKKFIMKIMETKNPDVLFIHGLMGSSTSFNDIINSLIDEYYVTAIDLPGHGKSNLSINFTILNEVSDVVEMFINHNFDDFTLLVIH